MLGFTLFDRVIADALRMVSVLDSSPSIAAQEQHECWRVIQALRGASVQWSGHDAPAEVSLEEAAQQLLIEPLRRGLWCHSRLTTLLCQAVQRAAQGRPGVAVRCLAVALMFEVWFPTAPEPLGPETRPSGLEVTRIEAISTFQLCCLLGELSDLAEVTDPLELIERIRVVQGVMIAEDALDLPYTSALKEEPVGVRLPSAEPRVLWEANLYWMHSLLHWRLADMNLPRPGTGDRRFFEAQLFYGLEQLTERLLRWPVIAGQTCWSPDDLGPFPRLNDQQEDLLLQALRRVRQLKLLPGTVQMGEVRAAQAFWGRGPQVQNQSDSIQNAAALGLSLSAEPFPGEPDRDWPRPEWMLIRNLLLYRCLRHLTAAHKAAAYTAVRRRPKIKYSLPTESMAWYALRTWGEMLSASFEGHVTLPPLRKGKETLLADLYQRASSSLNAALECPPRFAEFSQCAYLDAVLGRSLVELANVTQADIDIAGLT
ncbi:hypothetical protein GCM10022631_09900 [Deinococcus rubellus]